MAFEFENALSAQENLMKSKNNYKRAQDHYAKVVRELREAVANGSRTDNPLNEWAILNSTISDNYDVSYEDNIKKANKFTTALESNKNIIALHYFDNYNKYEHKISVGKLTNVEFALTDDAKLLLCINHQTEYRHCSSNLQGETQRVESGKSLEIGEYIKEFYKMGKIPLMRGMDDFFYYTYLGQEASNFLTRWQSCPQMQEYIKQII
tara:strand:- start:13444 stop:14067 length:624 start_codon:yes stop_codon:yes gene_type:complete